jgi:hypothetical protein
MLVASLESTGWRFRSQATRGHGRDLTKMAGRHDGWRQASPSPGDRRAADHVRGSGADRGRDGDPTEDRATTAGGSGAAFDDLRHTGNTWAAETEATLRDLMHRMVHTSARAALICQHATEERDREIAQGLSEQIERDRDRAPNGHGQRKQ